MEPGDLIVVNHRRHPLNGCKGKVVGRRGACGKDDTWILVYVPSRMRSYLIPQSLLAPDEVGADMPTWKLQ
jgi:hypothetical protein